MEFEEIMEHVARGFEVVGVAIIVIGGLVSSTLLTLVVLPVLYYLVEGAKERREDRKAAGTDRKSRRAAKEAGREVRPVATAE